jgi:UDP-N-acetyl-D-glucosamine dehydrogenase
MKSLNFPARFIDLATDINSRMPEHVVERVSDLLNEDRKSVNGAKILILGVAYKSNVGDMRESPALDIIRILAAKGGDVTFSDPHVSSIEVDGIKYEDVGTADKTLAAADIAVILTDHNAFDYKSIVANVTRVFDTRNATKDVTTDREKITKL